MLGTDEDNLAADDKRMSAALSALYDKQPEERGKKKGRGGLLYFGPQLEG